MNVMKPKLVKIQLNKEEEKILEKMKDFLTELEVAIDRTKDTGMDWEFENFDNQLDLDEISDRIRAIL